MILLKKFLIAGGNSTLLVWNCPSDQKKKVIDRYLGKVEQVGFIEETKKGLSKLVMMGDELCINSTLSLASQLPNSGLLLTSGINKPIRYENIGKNTYIELDITFKKIGNIILLPGIGFICTNIKPEISKSYLAKSANKYNLPAFGIVFYQNNKITPYVFVKGTDSLFEETACGSGSIACALVTGFRNIIQPTGEVITVINNKNGLIIGSRVILVNVNDR